MRALLLHVRQLSTPAVFALVCVAASLGCQPERNVKLPEIEVRLGQSVESIKGWRWLRLSDGSLSPADASELDHRLLLHLPRGQRFAVTTTTVFMGQDDGYLRDISITPRPELFKPKNVKTLEFDQVIAETERLGRELGLEDKKQFWEKLERWKKRRPNPSEVGSGVQDNIRLSKDVELTFKIENEIAGDGWYIALTFYDQRYYGKPRRWPPVSDQPVEAPKP